MASLVLHQVKEVGTVTQKDINTECKILTYISLALTLLGLVMVAIFHYRKLNLYRGCMFSNAVKIMIFISDVQYYVSIKLCKPARSIHLFKIMGMLKPENIKLNKKVYLGYLRNRLERSQCDLMTINLPRIVTIKPKDKIKIRCMMKKEPILFHVMLKQGIIWFTLACST